MVLKDCSYVGLPLHRVFVPSAFDWRARLDVDTSYFFPRGLLAALTLVGGRVRAGGSVAVAECDVGLPFCSIPIRCGGRSNLLEQKPWASSLGCSFPFQCVLAHLLAPLLLREAVLKQEGPMQAFGSWPDFDSCSSWLQWVSHRQRPKRPPMCPCADISYCCPCQDQPQAQVQVLCGPHGWLSALPSLHHPRCVVEPQCRAGWATWALWCVFGVLAMVDRLWSEFQAAS